MSSYLAHLKQANHCKSSRWIIKRNKEEEIKEIKLIYCPEDYKGRKLYTKEKLMELLDGEKKKIK